MKKRSFIDEIRVRDACPQAWDEMVGNDEVRFCTHCAKDVNNLSAMTRKEAARLVRKSGGSLCIRYVQRPEDTAPMFAGQLTQITRRRIPLMAAGVMSASLSLATMAYAQGGAATPPMKDTPAAAKVSECEDVPKAQVANIESAGNPEKTKPAAPAGAILRGTVVDPMGAVVPNAGVTLVDGPGARLKSIRTDADGAFRFEKLSSGIYALETEASGGFVASRVENIAVGDSEAIVEIMASIASESVTMGVVAYAPEFEGAIAIAVSRDDLEEARNLISRGENVNQKEEDGKTPIFIAVENGNIEMVQLLLDAGAKINSRNHEKATPLMHLDGDATPELVELLLRFGAKVHHVARSGDTALIRAARMATPEVVRALIDAGADLDAQNEDGATALMLAAETENLETVRVLVLAGASVNLKDKEGDTAWDKTSEVELKDLLETYGAIVEAVHD
ncbi:MAG: ankyrin repeat domain-containing protein [Pyrinomonadaceae bacterium]